MRYSVGLDLNGWHDFAARDPGEDTDGSGDMRVSVDGGYGSVVVETQKDKWIGGPQAILSPIGRGRGWSTIGAPEKRRDLRAVWPALLADSASADALDDLWAAADALAIRATEIALCMPDRPEMAEAGQRALLRSLAGTSRPVATLLWRSVALALAALDDDQLPQARDGLRVLCVVHAADGLEVQRLDLRALADHRGWLAPERGGPGRVLCHQVGLAGLLAEAEKIVTAANSQLADRPAETPRLPLALLLDECEPEPEVIRLDNGTWRLAKPPAEFRLPWGAFGAPPSLEAADIVLLHSPLATRHRDGLLAWLGLPGERLYVMMAPEAPAIGARHALRRIARGIPHYLDRLDQVSLAVLGSSGPKFEDLVPPNATVPGNREYVSDPNTSMIWPDGSDTVRFFVRKGEREIRAGTMPPVPAPTRNQKLVIRLRQRPAQGWANLLISAPDWEEFRPIRLEWSELQPDQRTADAVLEWLRGPDPVVPEAVHYPPEIGLWDGSLRRPGVRALLQGVGQRRPGSLKALADGLGSLYLQPNAKGARLLRCYPVGSDGSLPQGLDAGTAALFKQTIHRIAEHLMTDRGRVRTPPDNDALRCLTWCFAACPSAIIQELSEIVRLGEQSRSHPWSQPKRANVVVVQGLGRVATDPALLREMIPRLADGTTDRDRLAALATMLSRPLATPCVLDELGTASMSVIATRLAETLGALREQKKFGVHLKYALLAVGGLLRVRVKQKRALVADSSKPAARLAVELETIAKCLPDDPHSVAGATDKRQSAGELAQILRAKGGRPDILISMEALPDN